VMLFGLEMGGTAGTLGYGSLRRAACQGAGFSRAYRLKPSGIILADYGLVPKKGLEPPHPCEYMDLNHARLPIPPLRHDRIQLDWLDRQQLLVYKRQRR
jgi:hypothetical protein